MPQIAPTQLATSVPLSEVADRVRRWMATRLATPAGVVVLQRLIEDNDRLRKDNATLREAITAVTEMALYTKTQTGFTPIHFTH